MAVPIFGLLGSFMDVVSEGLKLANTKLSRKYLDEETELRLKLKALTERPYDDQDDVLYEQTVGSLKIWADGAKNAMELAKSEGT
jgi:hypothetical protein